MAKRKSFEEKNNFIHPTRKKIIDVAFGRDDNNQRVHGYEGETDKKKVGEVWTDVNGTTWEQKDGYRMSVNKMDEVRQYLQKLSTCSSENCETKIYSNADKKLIRKTGLCLECLRLFENNLRLDGTYPFYEDYKITRNQLAYAKELKERCEAAYGDIKEQLSFVNENGEIENWKWDIDVEQVKKDIDRDLEEANRAISELTERKVALEEKLTELNHPELIVK
jgi:cell fate (sporulation/competence/biofilm development) regulator YlbF (YheA/YmcA/DUF963 family)